MRYSVDQTHIHALNQCIILDRIFKNEAVSRSELSRLLHISKSAMTENISSLLDAGLCSLFAMSITQVLDELCHTSF